MMTNVMKFPDAVRASMRASKHSDNGGMRSSFDRFASATLKAAWVVTVLLWPLLKWIVSLDVVFQFGRMLFFWSAFNAGTFAAHFLFLVALTYFVVIFKPK